MRSYAHQQLSPEEIRKLAAEFTDEEIRASLHEDGMRPFVIQAKDGTGAVVGYWYDKIGNALLMMDDDSVRVYAQVEYMRRNGYPVFQSTLDIDAYAAEHGWPRKHGND